MQLHVCLLLLIIVTSDKTLALSHSHCGGDVSLDQGPVGHIRLTTPGQSTDQGVSQCTWMMEVPPRRTILLKVAQLETGSSVSVRCVWKKEDPDQVLERDGAAMLHGCDGNKAALTWKGAGNSRNVILLSYHVQEDEWNSSSESVHTRNLVDWSQTGTSFTSTASAHQEVVTRTQEARGHLHHGVESSPRLGPVSGHELLHPTSPLLGVSVTERGTPPFPEEGLHNGADTSGTARRTDGSTFATHPYFQRTDSSNIANTEPNSRNERAQAQLTLTDATAGRYSTFLSTNTYKYAGGDVVKQIAKQAHPTRSTSNVPPFTSPSLELTSVTYWDSALIPIPRGGAVSGIPEQSAAHSWRNHRSTDGLISELTPVITSVTSTSPLESLQDDFSRVHVSQFPESSKSSQTQTVTPLSSSSVSTEANESFRPNATFESATLDVSHVRTALFELTDKSDDTWELDVATAAAKTLSNSPQSTESLLRSPHALSAFTLAHTATESTQREIIGAYTTMNTVTSSPEAEGSTPAYTSSFSAPTAATETETNTPHPMTSNSPVPSSTFLYQTSHPHKQTIVSDISHTTHTLTSPSPMTTRLPIFPNQKPQKPTFSEASEIKSVSTSSHSPLPPSPAHKQPLNSITTAHSSQLSLTTASHTEYGRRDGQTEDVSPQPFLSTTAVHTPTDAPPQRASPWSTPYYRQERNTEVTSSALSSAPMQSFVTSQTPKIYVVPDQPAAVKVDTIELLLQIIVEESRSTFASGLEEDTTAWVEVYLQKAPGFSRLLGVWSSGQAVQILVEFQTRGAVQWLGVTGPASLLERTGLAQAARDRREFRLSKITNITLGGLQGDVCDWLIQCPLGYKCASQSDSANYTCSSACRFDYCHHHGICTHHPHQLPVCRCLVGEDFWYMGQRCDVRMTRVRLVAACLAILLVMVTVIGVLAFVAVRRYRAILIQAKVDQTRSSYRRFNHFDELSGRFWLRSWAGSADSMDNPAFTRSDELLHMRALDRPCCYHDDTLSLASTCPSHGARLNTIYPHSSQYGWRGSEMSMGDGVLDSGKASDLSVCSWPVEPIHWTPFPLLQQLAFQQHRTPTVRVSRPRSYCEGMELVEMGKSWTA